MVLLGNLPHALAACAVPSLLNGDPTKRHGCGKAVAVYQVWSVRFRKMSGRVMGEITVSKAHLAFGGKSQRVPTLIILLFWTLQFISLSIAQLAMGEADTLKFILPRLLACCVGMVLSAAILRLHERQAGRLLSARALRAFVLAVIASGIHAAADVHAEGE
jgi:hypothetical protein